MTKQERIKVMLRVTGLKIDALDVGTSYDRNVGNLMASKTTVTASFEILGNIYHRPIILRKELQDLIREDIERNILNMVKAEFSHLSKEAE